MTSLMKSHEKLEFADHFVDLLWIDGLCVKDQCSEDFVGADFSVGRVFVYLFDEVEETLMLFLEEAQREGLGLPYSRCRFDDR